MHKVLQEEPPAPSLLNVQVPRAFDSVLRKALAKRPEDRYQTGREFAEAVQAAGSGAALEPPPRAAAGGDGTVIDLMALAREAQEPHPEAAPTPAAMPASPAVSTPPPKSRTGLWLGAVVVIGLVAGTAWYALQQRESTPPQAMATPPPAAPRPPPNEKITLSSQPSARRFDAVEALDRIFEARDRNHRVTVVTDPPRIRIGADPLRFRVESAKGGYLYVLMVGTDRTQFNLLFPNAIDGDNRLLPGKEVRLPRAGWAMTAAGPKGTDHFVAIVSEQPRDFTAAGLRKVDPFGEFPADAAAAIFAKTGDAAVFAGTPACAAGAPCRDKYGAATFSIEEID
jgi:hypothetical protein